jgi:hypothetical protein
MKRELFKLKKFKLINAQDVEAEFRHDGKVINEKFTEPVHPDLMNVWSLLQIGFTSALGLEGNAKVAGAVLRGVNLSGDEDKELVILTGVVELTYGLKTNMNTPRMETDLLSSFIDGSVTDVFTALEDEVFQLLNKGKAAQQVLQFPEDVEDSNS